MYGLLLPRLIATTLNPPFTNLGTKYEPICPHAPITTTFINLPPFDKPILIQIKMTLKLVLSF